MKQREKVGILSLGCPRNIVDSEYILGRLRLKGYQVVEMDKADIGIINTCGFIKDAKVESIDAILDLIALKKQGRLKKVIVYGCLAQRYKDSLRKELPEVDAFVGSSALHQQVHRFPITPGHYAYLKICESCINNCSYCIIPKIKGRFTSLAMAEVLKKVGAAQKAKVRELNIIGQDISGYGIDLYGRVRLAELLRKICAAATSIPWIRLLYLHPQRIDKQLLDVIRGEEKVCKYIDLPLQHCNDRILALMNRRMQKKHLLRLVEQIRKSVPAVALRTCLIVGFPSETDREFKEMLSFVRQNRFERLGVFCYSREEGTAAAGLRKQVPQHIIQERFNLIMQAQQEVSRELNKGFLNKTLQVMIDEHAEGVYIGRSQYDAPEVDGTVYVHSEKKLRPGDFVKVRITDTLEYDLVGQA
jgi:ribosomal protein S12 methylthiotransferase